MAHLASIKDFHGKLCVSKNKIGHEVVELVFLAGLRKRDRGIEPGFLVKWFRLEHLSVSFRCVAIAFLLAQFFRIPEPRIGSGIAARYGQLELFHVRAPGALLRTAALCRERTTGVDKRVRGAHNKRDHQGNAGSQSRILDRIHEEYYTEVQRVVYILETTSRRARTDIRTLCLFMNNSKRTWPWIEICALLTIAQVIWAGYRFGVGNQSIQIPFLKHLINPVLYSSDPIITTMNSYPTYLFRFLAFFIPSETAVEPAYFIFHLLTAFGVLTGVWLLALAMFNSHRTALITVLLSLAGHQAGLAESSLYNAEFTHTSAALPIAIFALVLFYRQRYLLAFTLTGVLSNIHFLTAGYVAIAFGLWTLLNVRRLGILEVGTCFASFLAAALPAVLAVAVSLQVLDANWVRLLHIRSSHHVFSSSWWQAGNAEIPRFVILFAFGILCSLGSPAPSDTQRKTFTLFGALLGLLAAGIVFVEIIPVPIIMRAQLFRSSVFLVLLIIPYVAHWISITLWSESAENEDRPGKAVPPPARARILHGLEILNALLVFASFAFPAFTPFLPVLLVTSALLLLASARLSWIAAACLGIATLVCIAAWKQIHFPLFGLLDTNLLTMHPSIPAPEPVFLTALGACAALVVVFRYVENAWITGFARLLALVTFGILAFLAQNIAAPAAEPWTDVQRAARNLTSSKALLLVPAISGGFRIHSERSIVGEWRDGTQQFFDADFAERWWERMQAIRPGIMYDKSGAMLLSRGRDLGQLGDDEIAAICKTYAATHIVLPAGQKRNFCRLYENREWAIYTPEQLPPLPPPSHVTNTNEWKALTAFMQNVIYPNIEKYRKSDALITLTDAGGRPIQNVTCNIRQVSSSFHFGSILPPFEKPSSTPKGEDVSPPVKQEELDFFRPLFNFSIIGYSGKWNLIEPEEGKPKFLDLDRYVDWCTTNDIGLEYHFVSGYQPAWLKKKTAEEKQQLFIEHARRLVERYGDRIKYWQVVNETELIQQSPAVFELMRRLLPDAKLGISDCARFYSDQKDPQRRKKDLLRGMDEIKWLKSKGVKIDFFGFHGHRPFELWADARTMYEALNAFQAEGIRIHITEFGNQEGAKILSSFRQGQWNPELQAEYYRYYFMVCFSHPNVDVINLWGIGPYAWIKGAGLLDSKFKPKPSYYALKDLILKEWRTSLNARVGLDGIVRFRGFHGDYEVSFPSPSSEEPLIARFTVKPGAENRYKLVWNKENDTLSFVSVTGDVEESR